MKHCQHDNTRTSIYGAEDVAKPLPSAAFPEDSMRPEDAYELIKAELLLDGNARQNLATFCQTWDDEQIHKLMDLSISKNMIDKDEYPQCAELEMRCVRMIASLWNAPAQERIIGCSTIGSSEACMLGGMAALWRWRRKRQEEGKPCDKPNLVCGPVQICWHKFCRYWGVEIREIPMEKGQYCMSEKEILRRVDENTICVVPTFGVTYTGQYEFPEAVAQVLDKLAASGGPDVDIHVDAASGGFLAPFCAPEIPFDFRLPRVKSISSSGHKYGLAPLGCGWVIWRDENELPKELTFAVNYLGGSIPTIAINFSRPAGQVIAQYYNFVRLGKEGYKNIHMAAYNVAAYLAKEISKLGAFEFISQGNPQKDIPAVCFYMKANNATPYNLYELSDRLRIRGWQVPAFSLPAHVEDTVVMRIMVRQGFTMDMASLLIEDMKRGIDFLSQHTTAQHLEESEAMAFKHT
ncbi:MAG: glutamate decarboxylase [Akkermansia sp.]|nr:glutamate decarboxylase [Akkermansia sp.]